MDMLTVMFWLEIAIWFGCFVLVAVDSVYRGISPVFWRLAALFGGPFALLAYALVREKAGQKK